MGSFDNYVPDPPVLCPVCGVELRGWQGKDGPNLLVEWKQGVRYRERFPGEIVWDSIPAAERLKLWEAGDAPVILPPRFHIYSASCGKHWVFAEGKSTDGIWTETEVLGTQSAGQVSTDSDASRYTRSTIR